MSVIYQLLFFFSVAMLAVVVTLFVLAVSLLGRAIRLSFEEQTSAEENRKKDTESRIEVMKGKLDQAKAGGRLDTVGLNISILYLMIKGVIHNCRLGWIKMKPKLLTATWGALIPGTFCLIAVIFSVLALYRIDEASIASLYMWIAVATIGIGICFICLTLKIIEGVAITSEETSLIRDIEAFKSALRDIEEEKKPKLILDFTGSLPLHIEKDMESTTEFVLDLKQGEIARRPIVYFFAPTGFDFPKTGTWMQREEAGEVAGHITTKIEFVECRKLIRQLGDISIKAPSEKGTYPLWYRLTCEGFASELTQFEVVVEEEDIPF